MKNVCSLQVMILRDTSCPPDPRVCQLCNIVIGELRKSRTSFHPTSCFLMETDATSVEIHQLYFQRHNLHRERLNNGQICHFFSPSIAVLEWVNLLLLRWKETHKRATVGRAQYQMFVAWKPGAHFKTLRSVFTASVSAKIWLRRLV